MNVVLFTEVMSPYVSGISSYVEVLRKGLSKLGHKVMIVTSSLHVSKTVIKNGVIRCPAKESSNKYGYECKNVRDESVMRLLAQFVPDVVHIQTSDLTPQTGSAAPWFSRCMITTSTDLQANQSLSGSSRRISKKSISAI